jgi:hypothetical protein
LKLLLSNKKIGEKRKMKTLKNKIFAITISIFFILSMTASMMLMPNANAHSPPWNIPTYAYIMAFPNPIGVGQTINVYMWLDSVYGAAGGTSAAVGTNGYTASAALLANDYRFHNYKLTVTAPDGANTTTTFAVVSDPTSSQETQFTPTTVGTYTLTFNFPGQVYGANGDGYSVSALVGDTYLPSSASTTLTVQSTPITAATTSEPLPTTYWTRPIYGENSNWYSISSNWLGSGLPVGTGGSPPPAGYTSSPLYHGDAVGPLTGHIMWTLPTQNGGIVGGNMFPNDPGVGYFEGSSYEPRFQDPIIMDGYLYFTEVASFTGTLSVSTSSSGPTVCINLQTGQTVWSSMQIPKLSFGYIYDLYDPDQHGTFPPIIVAAVGGGLTGIPATWELFDAYTAEPLFNVTGVPAQTLANVPGGEGTLAAGPSGEQLRYVLANDGTVANPQWYLAEWNMSKLWQYDINPYTGTGSLSPSIINASNGVLVSELPIPITGETGTLPNGASVFIPYGSTLTVNANIPINSNANAPGTTTPIKNINADSLRTYDWNVSAPWLNTMPLQPVYNTVTGAITPATPGTNPVTVVASDPGDLMLCRNGSLPTGFSNDLTGYPQLPYTIFAVNLNASVGAIGSILWTQNYNPPTGNLTILQGPVDWQTRTFVMAYEETNQWIGYSLSTGKQIWGPTSPEVAFDYYDGPGSTGNLAYGTLYSSSYGGICYAFNDLTGATVFTYGNGPPGSGNSTYAGFNTPYGDYPTFVQSIAHGVVYLETDEHTITDPIYKGAFISAINATTGQQIWTLSSYGSEWSNSGSGSDFIVADGYASFFNGYDSQIYCVGRGPSATTVTAGPEVTTVGGNIVIQGTVKDVSAGTQQVEQKADFPNGVPVCSDATMQQWMGYVYQQQAEPTNFTGVPVTISVLDSNGNHYVIGTATTDESGSYSLTWAPGISGNFTIYASFAGTNGYWSSSAETHIWAGNAPPTATPTATPLTGLASNTTLMYGVIAIVIVIIIIGAAILLVLSRKRP